MTFKDTISLKEYNFGTPGLPCDDWMLGETRPTLSQYLS
tara:strand:- start:343 stop:459 length:117 start_codon:yes stop_codon:yes gene_type:complete